MNVLIKGMEMPITCCHCPLMGYDPDIEWNDGGRAQGAYICVVTHELIDNTKREDHCPLVPVPEHGRLGDLDELLDRAFGCLDEETFLAFQFLVNGSVTIIPAEEGEG